MLTALRNLKDATSDATGDPASALVRLLVNNSPEEVFTSLVYLCGADEPGWSRVLTRVGRFLKCSRLLSAEAQYDIRVRSRVLSVPRNPADDVSKLQNFIDLAVEKDDPELFSKALGMFRCINMKTLVNTLVSLGKVGCLHRLINIVRETPAGRFGIGTILVEIRKMMKLGTASLSAQFIGWSWRTRCYMHEQVLAILTSPGMPNRTCPEQVALNRALNDILPSLFNLLQYDQVVSYIDVALTGNNFDFLGSVLNHSKTRMTHREFVTLVVTRAAAAMNLQDCDDFGLVLDESTFTRRYKLMELVRKFHGAVVKGHDEGRIDDINFKRIIKVMEIFPLSPADLVKRRRAGCLALDEDYYYALSLFIPIVRVCTDYWTCGAAASPKRRHFRPNPLHKLPVILVTGVMVPILFGEIE